MTDPSQGRGAEFWRRRRVSPSMAAGRRAASNRAERLRNKVSCTSQWGDGIMNTSSCSKYAAKATGDRDCWKASKSRSLKVLVVDDSIILLRVLQEGLEEFGHTIIGAQSGSEALEILEETKVDVVVCDLGMPDMNGWDVGKAVLDSFASGRTRSKIPFILLTGWASRLTPEDTEPDSGVDAILEKPIDLRALAMKLDELAAR